jgi:hypothetical protein
MREILTFHYQQDSLRSELGAAGLLTLVATLGDVEHLLQVEIHNNVSVRTGPRPPAFRRLFIDGRVAGWAIEHAVTYKKMVFCRLNSTKNRRI